MSAIVCRPSVFLVLFLACTAFGDQSESPISESQRVPIFQRMLEMEPDAVDSYSPTAPEVKAESDLEEELYTGLRIGQDFLGVGFKSARRGIHRTGIEYTWDKSDRPLEFGIERLLLAVHPSRDVAIDSFDAMSMIPAVRFTQAGTELGDFYVAWMGGVGNGTIQVLVGNIVISMIWDREAEDAIQFMRNFVEEIRVNRDVAPKGTFAVEPKLRLRKDDIAQLSSGRVESIRPEVHGLGQSVQIRASAVSLEKSGARASFRLYDGSNGEFRLYEGDKSRPSVSERREDFERHEVHMRAADDMHVFVSTVVQVPLE